MANTISVTRCSICGCVREVNHYPGKGKCDACYKREQYHLSKTPASMAARAVSTSKGRDIKRLDQDAWKAGVRRNNLKSMYNLSVEQYDAQADAQGNMCALCGREPVDIRLAVDHDHACCAESSKSCGKCLRGLLCRDCNTGIGSFKDDIRVLARAISYLTGGGVWVE